ncbi:MAG: hypothetical protein K8L97_10790 [Anaerolineae bacterium]|nr:hypothetical protein [Anaerolineae bacterium]
MAAVKVILTCAGLLIGFIPTLAQNNTLEPLSPVTGQIESGGTQSWTFNAADGAVFSFHIQAETGDLDPAFTISNSAGTALIGNDDYDYPDTNDALLEAITFPRLDTYTLTVTGFDGTSGDYTLTMTPGFTQLAQSENFNGNLEWEAPEPLEIQSEDGQLVLALAEPEQTGIALHTDIQTPNTYYAQVNVNVSGESGWIVSMTARQQNDETYYVLNINNQGQWRFSLRSNGSSQIVRDWTPHPAIIPGGATFTLGMLVNGIGFDFFYDGQFFGRATDSTLTELGTIGLGIETPSSLTSRVEARFDDLTITEPLILDDQSVLPEQLIVSTPNNMAQELQRRLVIPSGGEMALTVNESFVESRRPGVERLMLGRGATYENFAMGATVAWESASSGVTGCGLVFRGVDDTNYMLAYVDGNGGYGVSQRDDDTFLPGIFGETLPSTQNRHQLVVIARGENIIYYVDGRYIGSSSGPTVEGAVGNAVVNFEPISTSCQFTETWVWRWN